MLYLKENDSVRLYEELGNKPGITLHQIAEATDRYFRDVKKDLENRGYIDRLKTIYGENSAVEISTSNITNRLPVKSWVFTIPLAKHILAASRSEKGDLYLKGLIELEEKVIELEFKNEILQAKLRNLSHKQLKAFEDFNKMVEDNRQLSAKQEQYFNGLKKTLQVVE